MMANPTAAKQASKAEETIRVLFVDDERSILNSLQRQFRNSEYKIFTAESGKDGLEVLKQNEIDVVVSDMRMPEMSGAEFLSFCAQKWPQHARIVLTGHEDIGEAIRAINQGHIYRYLNKPWDEWELQHAIRQAASQVRLVRDNVKLDAITQQQFEELKLLNESLEQKVNKRTEELQVTAKHLDEAYADLKLSYRQTVEVFSRLAEMKQSNIKHHSRHVACLSRIIAEELNLKKSDIDDIYSAGLLHDIGRLVLPDELCSRPESKLTQKEKKQMEQLPMLAEAALFRLKPLLNAARIIRHHHERIDGKGYPDRLSGDAIPLGSRILAVSDTYYGLSSGTRTGVKHSTAEALEHIRINCGTFYQEEIFTALKKIIQAKENEPLGSVNEIMLNTEELVAGMELARDLIINDSLLLLTSGKALSTKVIKRIKQFEQDFDTQYTLYVKS